MARWKDTSSIGLKERSPSTCYLRRHGPILRVANRVTPGFEYRREGVDRQQILRLSARRHDGDFLNAELCDPLVHSVISGKLIRQASIAYQHRCGRAGRVNCIERTFAIV